MHEYKILGATLSKFLGVGEGGSSPSCLLEYSCNKCCDLIGHSEVSISHKDLQVFIETYNYSQGQRKMHSATVA